MRVVKVEIRVKAGSVGAFLALAESHQQASRREYGCHRFDLLRDHADHLHFVLWEEWEDQAAILRHRETDHYFLWRERIGSMEEFPRIHEEFEALPPKAPVIVWTNGVFDLFHTGHLHVLQEARKQGDKLIVGINTDESVRRLKGRGRPVQPLEVRGRMLGALSCVNQIITFATEEELLNIIKGIRPAVLVKGSDAMAAIRIPGSEYAGRVHFVERLPGYSTTAILQGLPCPNPSASS